MRMTCSQWIAVVAIGAGCFLPGLNAWGQAESGTDAAAATCAVVPEHELTAAEKEFSNGRYQRADDLYGEELNRHPEDLAISAAFVNTLLHEGDFDRALSRVNKSLLQNPHSAITLTALADVQLHQGQPWLALETLKAAASADPCYARVHLVRSRALRIDSMYAMERAEIQKAYDIDPNDPDIKHEWLSVNNPAKEIEGIAGSLETMKDLDAETRQKAQASIDEMLPMLSENSQTCKILPTVDSAVVPLMPTMMDASSSSVTEGAVSSNVHHTSGGKRVESYKLEAQFPQSVARLIVDTGASGFFISRALADLNGLKPGPGDPQGTARLDHVKIGPLEFGNCLVGVSETPFSGKMDGFIGTDVFSSYLITLDHPHAKLTLEPLPKTTLLPGDRLSASALPVELQGFMPVYHRQQYLLVPATLDGKARRLFILDTGVRFSTMRSDVAHLVSTTKVNFTNPVQTISGSTLQVYRDSFDFQLANLALNHQSHILEMDTEAIDRNSGLQLAGMLGFDMLHSFVLHLDYRDGLVKLESAEAGVTGGQAGGSLLARNGAPEEECKPEDDRDRPLNTTLQAKVLGLIDSTRLKPGKEVIVKLVKGWSDDECQMDAGAVVYGHVTASSNGSTSELGLMFDRAECNKGARKLDLRLIGVVAAPDQFVGLHTALPSQVGGRGRNISNLAGDTGLPTDENLNPDGPPQTIHPGIVVGLQNVDLDPLGGPGCSSKISSKDKSIHLSTGAQLIFSRQSAR